jgi:hypothetical protein
VWKRLHHFLLQRLADADHIDLERASVDSASVPAPGGGEQTGKDPTNRGKLGANRHLVVNRHSILLAVSISASYVHDSRMLEESVDAIPPLRLAHQHRGRPRKRPKKLRADKGYDYPRCRWVLRRRVSPDAGSNRVSDWDGTAGSWSALSPGSIASAASKCATSVAPTSMRRFLLRVRPHLLAKIHR